MNLIKIPMPWRYRLHNFRFNKDGSIFWTSATHSVWQKLKRLLLKGKPKMCNTNGGYTLESHGQVISNYPDSNGKYYPIKQSTVGLYRPRGAGFLQGVWEEFALYGSPNKEDILVTVNNSRTLAQIKYNNFSKWYWKYWEAEGICKDSNGSLWIGISVKTWFLGRIINYRYRVYT